MDIGCVIFTLVYKYTNTQKIVQRFFSAAVLLCIPLVKKMFLLRGYVDIHYKMTISYLCI